MINGSRPFEGSLIIEDYANTADVYLKTGLLGEIMFNAWRAQLSERTEPEIEAVTTSPEAHQNRHQVFDSIESANRRYPAGRMRQFGHGVVLLARAPVLSSNRSEQTIGFVIARNNVSGSTVDRFRKTHIKRQKPYAWVQNINVLPEYQGVGVGTALLETAMQHFESDQHPTAYVFDENIAALTFFANRGFAIKPEPQKPTPLADYFGPGTEPPLQWRLEAPRVVRVQNACYEQLQKTGLEYTTGTV